MLDQIKHYLKREKSRERSPGDGGTAEGSGRTIFIGDVHGCIEELRRLAELLQIRKRDRVILLGDLINRGPQPAKTVRYVHDSGFECIMGNHEMDYIRHFRTNSRYLKLKKELGRTLHKWILERPLYIESDRFLAVHAGLIPGLHPKESPPDIILNIRTWDGSGKDLKSPDNPPWYEYYRGKRTIVYGHWARQGLMVRSNTIGLDSGCVYGSYLSAWILESGELVQVKASRMYARPRTTGGQA